MSDPHADPHTHHIWNRGPLKYIAVALDLNTVAVPVAVLAHSRGNQFGTKSYLLSIRDCCRSAAQ